MSYFFQFTLHDLRVSFLSPTSILQLRLTFKMALQAPEQRCVKEKDNERYAALSKLNRDANNYLQPNTVHLCIFGIEDVSFFQQIIHILRYKRSIPQRAHWISQVKTIEDAIKFYKAAAGHCHCHASSEGKARRIQFKIINSFLTEDVYNHKSIKYSNIIQNYPYKDYYWYLRTNYGYHGPNGVYAYGHNVPAVAAGNIGVNTTEQREEKYSIDIYDDDDEDTERFTLRTNHILMADAFIIFYDVRYQSELQKVQKYLDEIFKMKGYDKLLQKVKKDEMCLFPVYIIGINGDIRAF